MQESLGWVIRHKAYKTFGGHRARCKVFSSKRLALNAARTNIRDGFCTQYWADGTPYQVTSSRPQTDEEVLENWVLAEVFADFSEGST